MIDKREKLYSCGLRPSKLLLAVLGLGQSARSVDSKEKIKYPGRLRSRC
jgi:hypothetical protein